MIGDGTTIVLDKTGVLFYRRDRDSCDIIHRYNANIQENIRFFLHREDIMAGIKFEAIVSMEYELREGMTIEDLTDEVIDQIRNGEYFSSRVKDVHVIPLHEAS